MRASKHLSNRHGFVLRCVSFVLLLAVLPALFKGEFALFLGTQIGIYFLVALGLNLLSGYGGQISLGHGALVAIGAYAVAISTVDYHLSFWLALPLALALTAGAGALMALPAFRLSTWYFALVTLAFAEVFRIIANAAPITGGAAGTARGAGVDGTAGGGGVGGNGGTAGAAGKSSSVVARACTPGVQQRGGARGASWGRLLPQPLRVAQRAPTLRRPALSSQQQRARSSGLSIARAIAH